jgi:hypothetical protein
MRTIRKTGAPQGHCVKCRVGMAEQQTLSGRKAMTEDWISVLHYALFSLHMRSVCRSIFVGLGTGNERLHPVAMCHAPAGAGVWGTRKPRARQDHEVATLRYWTLQNRHADHRSFVLRSSHPCRFADRHLERRIRRCSGVSACRFWHSRFRLQAAASLLPVLCLMDLVGRACISVNGTGQRCGSCCRVPLPVFWRTPSRSAC